MKMLALLKRCVASIVSKTDAGRTFIHTRNFRHHLRRVGWLKSCEKRLPVDDQGNPLPWYTYGAIAFLAGRVTPDLVVFEYGSGNSTLWWAERTRLVVSYEHDREWFKAFHDSVPSSVEYHCEELMRGGDYCAAVVSDGRSFDVVAIDGRDRVNCARNAVSALSDTGIIVWDNGERPEYEEGFAFLRESGFRRLDFMGLGPINAHDWITTIFYRPGNCLDI